MEEKLPVSPFPHWLAFVLTNPFRKWSMKPAEIVKQAGVKSGDVVLEIGCGPGVFTEYLAAAVGSSGKVIAQDVQEQMLTKLEKRRRRFAVSENIDTLLADSAATGLESNSVDIVFAANVFEEISKEGKLAGTAVELRRVLKKDGRLFLGEHRVPRNLLTKIVDAIDKAGFNKLRDFDGLLFYAALYRLSAEKTGKKNQPDNKRQ